MGRDDVLQELQKFVIENGLPKTDMALFGIKCPYCGKSDRIRQLEDPDELPEGMDPEVIKRYEELWKNLTQSSGSLGVCKFCNNPLGISMDQGKAEPLYE
ncbi:MAG: hypothetical protein PVH02_15750 [Desulfobacteraceae bacterium]|jgi:hypothetical protein